MTPDDDERGRASSGTDDTGGFVFGEEGLVSNRGGSNTTLEQRLAPIVALLVIVSLVLTGGYLVLATLGGPSEDVLGSTAGAGSGDNETNGSTGASGTATAGDTTATVTSGGPSTTGTHATIDSSATPRPTGPTTTDTPRTTEEPTATESATDASTTSEESTTAREPTETATEPSTAETTMTGEQEVDTETPAPSEGRSPSIDDVSLSEGAGDSGGPVTVAWAVSDPDGDLETVRIRLVSEPDGNARVVDSRTIAVDGSDASGETVLELDGVDPGAAYELQFEAEDRTGEIALVVIREIAGE